MKRLAEVIIFAIIIVGIGTLVHEYVHIVQHEQTGLFNASYIGFGMNVTNSYSWPQPALYIYSTFKLGVTDEQKDAFNNGSFTRENVAFSIEIMFIVVVFLVLFYWKPTPQL